MVNRLLLLALLLGVTCHAAWGQNPVGAEFQINSYTTGDQVLAKVASDAIGNFVVVWDSPGQDGSGSGVFGQRFNAAGLPLGSEFQVNSFTTGTQSRPAVASDANGDFVVVWGSGLQDGDGWGVLGQRFNAAGLPLGSEFQVNTYTTGTQLQPAVASNASGDFVVVWISYPQDGSIFGIFGQRFNAAGLPQGSEFRVNSYTPGTQNYPAVASDASGNFVVVWTSSGQDGSSDGVFGQRFHAFGLPLGSEFQVNSYTTGIQSYPAVASDPNGDFVVVWESYGQDGSLSGIFGQRFNASGVPQGSEFRANTYAALWQRKPAVAADANGNFVVAWDSIFQDGSGNGVFGQLFSAGGVPQGPEFQVNSYTTSYQNFSSVASAANGNFVVAWTSDSQDGNYSGVFGQRFGDLIFKNGFQ